MKQISRFLMSAMLLLTLFGGVFASGQAPKEQLMPRWGKQVVTVSEELVFYDYKGVGDFQSSNSDNTLATIVFKPAEPGTVIQITFEDFDLRSDFGSYMGYAIVYNGEVDPQNTFVYPTTTSEVTSQSKLPDGDVLEKLDGQFIDKTYMSTSSDGSLSVGCIFRYGKKSSGWVARVNAIKVSDMEVTGAGGVNSHVLSSPAGKKGIALAGAYVTAKGVLNPVSLTEVSFSVLQNERVVDPQQLCLYAGELSEYKNEKPLETTLSEQGGVYTFRLTEPLRDGRNAFTIGGDVLADAAFGSKVQVNVTGVKTSASSAEVPGFVAADPVEVVIPNMVLMPAGNSSFTVGDSPIMFFDDGGKEGKISENFQGTVVFRPATSGKKVMVDFTKVTLFESSNKNEILNVYNGSEANPSNLICRIRSGKPELVRSSASDGALTVTLACDTGFPKDGFEATVSQFVPQAMSVETIAVAQNQLGTACAGDVEKPVMSIKIRTADTEPALTASKFVFTANGTHAQVAKASLFRTGRSSEFSVSEKIGEVAVTADDFTIVATTPVALTEGDNYFWLAYDIAGSVVNGAKIDAKIQSITLSDGDHAVEAGNPVGEMIVENKVVSRVGTVEKTVYGTWKFVSEKNPLSSYNGYNPVEGDQVTTFVPGTKGMIIELDIQSFALYYSTNSWATKAKFEVYSGKGKSGELLWSLTDAADKDKGPGRILRSKSADGALTVVFDAKTTSPSYTAKGWEAEVREYQSKPMAVEAVAVTQAGQGSLKPGAKNQEIIGFNVLASGDLDAPTVSEVKINLKESKNAVEKVLLYYSGSKNEVAKETPVATAAVSGETAQVTLTLAEPLRLQEGDNYFWIAYDLSEVAAVDTQIDAALESVKVDSQTIVPEQGDPEGFCTVKNLFLMQSGENGEVVVGESSLMFYDTGGPDGKTPKGFKGTVTFVPKDAGKAIRMSFRQWKPNGNYDKMQIYYGGEATSTEDVKLQAQDALPADVVSKSADGKLTVKFTSPSYSYQSDGWEIEVSQYELQPLQVAAVAAVAVAPEKVMRGMTDVAMLDVAVTVSGDKGELDLTSVKVSADGTKDGALAGMSVFATGQETAFSPVDRIMQSSEAPYELSGSYKITQAGVYHFWVTCDVASEAGIFDALAVSLNELSVSGATFSPAEAVKAETKVQKGVSGTLTVGEDCEYVTIQSAIDAIKGGIDGPVTIRVKPGSYEEIVTVPEIPGASQVNAICLQSETGKREDVVIFSNYYAEPPYSDDKMSAEYGVVTFDGVDYFTLKDVSVTTTDLNYPSVVHFRNQSRHVTVDNCHVYAERSESASAAEDIRLISQYAKNEPNCNNDFPTVRNCLIDGGYMGVVIQGTSFVRLPKQCGAVVENNTFRNQGSKALYSTSRERDMVIRGNVIENTTTTKSGFYAIDIETSENLLMEANSIYLATEKDATAINVRGIAGTEEKPGRIVNNEVAVVCADATSAGIKLSSASSHVDIAYNTVLITKAASAQSGQGVALWLNNTTTAVTVRNNLLMEKEEGYVYRFYRDNCYEGVSFSNNMLYTDGKECAKSNPTMFASFADWTAASGEKDSRNEEVSFYSSTILFPTEAGNLNYAMPLAYATTDKDGNLRDGNNPTIGAYEYSALADAPVYAEGYPSFGGITNVKAVATLCTTSNATAFTLLRPTSEAVPTLEEVLASPQMTELRKGKTTVLSLDGLSRQTEYKLYSVLMSLNGLGVSEVIASEPFATTYDPTEMSTFEDVALSDAGFTDGTASFTGFTVETIDDAVVEGVKAAKVGNGASITLTNTDKGLTLTGFFLKSDAELSLSVYAGNGDKTDYSVPSTGNVWSFVNLKDKGAVAKLDMTTEGNAMIDNFSGQPLKLAVTTSASELVVEEGVETVISAEPSGGVAPYRYVWKDAMLQEVSTASDCVLATPKHSAAYTLVVTDAWGQSADARVLIYVKGSSCVATFDDNYLTPESHYNGLGEDNSDWTHPGTDSKFFSGSYAFSTNRHNATWWGGFGVSNETSTSFASLADQYRSAAGGGRASANYGVAYAPAVGSTYAVEVTHAPVQGAVVSGFYVTNSAYTADAIVHGDGMSTPPGGFEEGDYLKLIVTAERGDGTVSSLDYYLADYRSKKAVDHYWLDTWQWVDLRGLGDVKKFTFGFEGTKKNEYGLTTPTYFCLDDFGGEREIADAPRQLAGTSSAMQVALEDFFTLDNDGSTVDYRITDPCDATVATVSVNEEGLLSVVGLQDKQTVEVIVSARQKGKLQFVRIPVEIDEHKYSSVDAAAFADAVIFPIPADDYLNIRTSMTGYVIEVTSPSGTCVLRREGNTGNVTVPVSHLAKGVYVLTLYNANTSIVKRFIVK